MRRNLTIIRPVLAFVMLLIFSLSITPKRYLHDLFAGHKDTITKTANDGKAHVTQQGFSCDCNTLVATSPFTEHTDEIKITGLPEYPYLFASFLITVHTVSHSFIELRGPPSIG